MAKQSIHSIILSAGASLRTARQQVTQTHIAVLNEIAESGVISKCKKRPTAVWFSLFVKTMNQKKDFSWPVKSDSNTEAIGYRTVMRNEGEYPLDVVNAAYYFNSLQSFLHSNDKVQPVKKQATRSSVGHVTTADQIMKQLDAILANVPAENREKSLFHLTRFAKTAFGIVGYSGKAVTQ